MQRFIAFICFLAVLLLAQAEKRVEEGHAGHTGAGAQRHHAPHHAGSGAHGFGRSGLHHAPIAHNQLHGGPVSSNQMTGSGKGCTYTTEYVTNAKASFPMCTGQTGQDLKNGMSIINLVNSRGYLPTCRIMQLMLWMHAEVQPGKKLQRETFVDIGANIGSCSVLMASLGFPTIAVEPVQEHVDTIQGSIDINPSFHIDLQHIGLAPEEKTIKANFGHGARNWGATEFHEVGENETFTEELQLKTFEQIVGQKKISLVKIDCEGCEWAALKGASRAMMRIPMIKIEVVQPSYEAGNETVTAETLLQYMESHGFDLYTDLWAENDLYFGKKSGEVLEIDKMFGSKKFNIQSDKKVLDDAAKRILEHPINGSNFNHRHFLRSATDVIAIEKSLSFRMKRKWLQGLDE
jgi:FkbM family methyltransferase